MRDEISLRTEVQREQPGYVEGFFFFNPAANILLLAVEPTAVPGSGRLSVLFTPWGQCRLLRLCCRLGLGLFRLRRVACLRLIFIWSTPACTRCVTS